MLVITGIFRLIYVYTVEILSKYKNKRVIVSEKRQLVINYEFLSNKILILNFIYIEFPTHT